MPPFYRGPETPKCPKCGRSLPASDAKCVYCSGETGRMIGRLMRLLIPYKRQVIGMMLLNVLGVLVGLAPPYLTKHIIDDVILSEDPGSQRMRMLVIIAVSMSAVALIRCIVKYMGGALAAKVGSSVVYDLRSRLHDTLQRLELTFFGRRNSGEYTGRIMHDTEAVQRFLIDGSTDLVVEVLTMIGIACVLLAMDWKLALIVFAPMPILVVVSHFFHLRIHSMFHAQGTGIAKLNTHISETINGIRTIKAFSHENHRSEIFDGSASELASTRVSLEKKFFVFSGSMETVMETATACVWFVAGWRMIGGSSLTLGDLTAFLGYIAMFYGPIRWLTHVVNGMVNAIVSAERIFSILDAPREDTNNGRNITLQDIRGDIVIDDVHFGYSKDAEVLKGITLHVRPGEMVGLVGHSGVGKSTLINLICRFYRVNSGDIRIDGVSVNDLNLASYRKKIGMVLQESFLFNATIFENIACAKPAATMDEVQAAAKAARAHDFIMSREDGYNSIVGEGGILLSGGERQRIAIARAILHNPPILILDEATSAVDTQTELMIRSAIAELCKGRSVIAIAHRLSTLRNANRLVVIEDGKVAEEGSHDELMGLGGIYAGLVKAQSAMNEIKSDVFNA